MTTARIEPRVDKSAFSVVSITIDDERFYWLSKTPEERLQHMQYLRLINYGDSASARLQRVLEITQRESS